MPQLPDITAYLDALERRVVGRMLWRVNLVSPFVLGGTMYVLYELTVLFIKRSGR